MPFYEFKCRECGVTAQERRSYDAMNEPGKPCAKCGGSPERIFSPTNNLFVPLAYQHTWSDFHDETEKELARKYPDAERMSTALSRPSTKLAREKEAKQARIAAATEAIAIVDAKYAAMGIPTNG